MPITHSKGGNQATSSGAPLPTITTAKGGEFAQATVTLAPHVTKFRTGSVGSHAAEPTRRELANAQGFPPGYVLDPIGPKGKPLSISSSIRMIGNSVCPDMAEALARANVRAELVDQVAA
ncbi:hypothetical protein K7957_07600 [Sphingomonas yunnanensis]|uniref:hypothetical protein n=1 Tax=Sphingomonas yunnanensis TaxID=310400 RepID=UPI001CA78E9A|nr:hypothetical protein [Sphingomonas yunnanensis]MBY9062792.1 hypothetical protein [Sphingomonas yunnanensis]